MPRPTPRSFTSPRTLRAAGHSAVLVAAFLVAAFLAAAGSARADSPEIAMRDFASGQIKKGVRSIGFGGDGATWGNYGLVWRDHDTVLADYGDTSYSNGNGFHFAALGATTPSLWHELAVYVIAMKEDSGLLHLDLKSPGLGTHPKPVVGRGADQALFSKIALPLTGSLSAGVLLSYEKSHFDARETGSPQAAVRYDTSWRPSGGAGIAWQPNPRVLLGLRALFNNDQEHRTDPLGAAAGLARSVEYRLGGSLAPWRGALIDVGATRLEKRNTVSGTHSISYEPNIGFEQNLLPQRLTVRFGVDETSPTAGLSLKLHPFNLDLAYVRNMARARVGELFGARGDSIVATLTLDDALIGGRP